MKKTISTIALSTILALSLNANDSIDLKQFNNIPMLKDFKILKSKDLGDIYQLKASSPRDGKNFEVFLTKDKKNIIFGSGYNTQTKQKLIFKTDMSKYKEFEAFSYGSGKDEYYVFTDPQCPFCTKFEKLMLKLKDKATFHVFLFPLSFHKEAKPMSLYVLSQPKDKRAVALKDIMMNKSTIYKTANVSKEAKKLLKDNLKVAGEMSVSGTPSVFDKDGVKIANWNSLTNKYNVQLDSIDPRFLNKMDEFSIKLSDLKDKKEVYLFLDIEKDKNYLQTKEYKNLLKTKNIKLLILARSNKAAIAKALIIEASEDKKKSFFKYVNKTLSPQDVKSASELLKDKKVAKPVMTIAYISDMLHINKTPLVVSKDGKVISTK